MEPPDTNQGDIAPRRLAVYIREDCVFDWRRVRKPFARSSRDAIKLGCFRLVAREKPLGDRRAVGFATPRDPDRAPCDQGIGARSISDRPPRPPRCSRASAAVAPPRALTKGPVGTNATPTKSSTAPSRLSLAWDT